jgi:carbamoyl-phosphate synthase large subunit
MLGQTLKEQGYKTGLWPRQKLVAIKAPVFSMSKLIGVDTYLGPEMKSTGEVMGIDKEFPAALAKALLSAELMLPSGGGVLLSIADKNKAESVPIIRELAQARFRLYATEGTADMIRGLGMDVEEVTKRLSEGHPNVVDVIQQGKVDCVVNTPEGGGPSAMRDGFQIRRAAVENRIPCFTSLDTARAAVRALLLGSQTMPAGAMPYTVQPLRLYLRHDGLGKDAPGA